MSVSVFQQHNIKVTQWAVTRRHRMTMTGCEAVLILVSLAIIISLSRLETNLLVILLEGREVLSGLRELSLLHTLADIPVDEGPLGVHQVELVVEPGPGLS